MNLPQVNMWIDARNERFSAESRKTQKYRIKELDSNEVRTKVYEALGTIVSEIRLEPGPENMIAVDYDSNLVTASFLDYRLRSRGVDFTRDGG